ncbi:histidine kinase [Croceiramulus getboli]|nr:histidine kinase [Flavobacteriaceae bacterium YJPT1-3]
MIIPRIVLVFWLLFFGTCVAQSDFEIVPVPLITEAGSKVQERKMLLDHDGFLWYTSNLGLSRFMGDTTVFYSWEEGLNKRVSEVRQIHEDSKGRIYTTTDIGVHQLDPFSGAQRWHFFFDAKDSIALKPTQSILDSRDQIWSSSSTGVVICLNSRGATDYFHLESNDPVIDNSNLSTVLHQDSNGGLYARKTESFFVYDNTTFKKNDEISHWLRSNFDPEKYNLQVFLADELFTSNSSGAVWLEGNRYPFHFSKELSLYVWLSPLGNWRKTNNINVCPKPANAVLIGTTGTQESNLSSYLLREGHTDEPRAEKNHSIYLEGSIYDNIGDEKDALWVSTSRGIYRIKQKNPYIKRMLVSEDPNQSVSVRDMIKGPHGDIYIGSYSGLFKLSTGESEPQPFPIIQTDFDGKELRTIRSMAWDTENTLYAVGESKSVQLIDLSSKTCRSFHSDNDKQQVFYKIIKLDQGEYLLGSSRGLWHFDGKTKAFTDYSQLSEDVTIEQTDIVDLLLGQNNNLWIVTLDNGVYLKNLDSGWVTHITENSAPASLPTNTVYTIKENEKNGLVTLGTNEGLVVLSYEDSITYNNTTIDCCKNDQIVGILESNESYWMSTYDGLKRYEKDDYFISEFFVEDGLADNEFNQEAHLKINDTLFYFGGVNGIIEMNPYRVNKKEGNPLIHLVAMEYYKADNLVYQVTGFRESEYTFHIPFEKNFFTATFAINDNFRPENAQFEYRIEGIHDQWQLMSADGRLRSFGLRPGDNTLRVRGANASGIHTDNELVLNIEVGQVFYKTWWFSLLVVLCILSLLYWRFASNQTRVKRIERRRLQRAKLEVKALRAQMNPHFISNALNGIQSVMLLKGEEEANRYLGAFSRLLRSTLDMSNSELTVLQDELLYINSYLELERFRQQDLEYNVVVDPQLDLLNTEVPSMLFQPILENAILHGLAPKKNGRKVLNVIFEQQDPKLLCIIEDNGIGRIASAELNRLKMKTHKSWSTAILNERIEIINYFNKNAINYNVEDLQSFGEPSGTRVTMKLPLRGLKL